MQFVVHSILMEEMADVCLYYYYTVFTTTLL